MSSVDSRSTSRRSLGDRPSPTHADPDTADPGVVRNTVLATAAQVVTAVLAAVLTLYLTRTLGPNAFGEFALAMGVAGILLVPADLGISPSVGRFIAEHRRDRATAASFLASANGLKLLLSLLIGVALFAAAGPLASAYGNAHLTWPFRGAAVVLFGQSMFALYSSALVSSGRLGDNLRLYTAESVAETAASIALVALGTGAGGAAFGRAAGYILGGVAGGALAYRAFGRGSLAPRAATRGRLSQVVRYAGVMFVVNGIWTLLGQTSVLLLGAYAGTTQVGLFSAPNRLSTVLHYPGLAIQNSVAPRLARGRNVKPDVKAFMASMRYLMILQTIITAVILVWADPIIRLLLGHRYAGSASVLRVMAPFIFLQGIGPLVSVGVNYLGESRQRILIAGASLAVQLILAVILIPAHGAVGAAGAASAGYALYVPEHLLLCRDLLGISLRPLVATLARSVAAAALAAGVLALAGTSHLTPVAWVSGSIGALAVFVAALLATGELTRGELGRAYALLARRRPWRAAG
jgi:O-antigen/teichoic acid export membrane protein